MKQTPKSSIRDIVSTREAIALATLLSVAHSAAAEPAKKEENKDQKKKGQDGQVMDEVTVSAVRENTYKTEKLTSPKTAPLRDVPQTVTVIPKEIIQEQGATTLTEILRNVPGITMTGGENGNAGTVGGDNVMLRGFDASNSVFADGVRDTSLITRDSYNLESAEVFQGPTGSDVGRGNAAGYINLNTKVPHLGNSYGGSAQYATGDRQRYTLDLNQQLPRGEQQWIGGAAMRLNGVYQDGGIAGRDIAERNVVGIAPSFALGLGTSTRAYFSYEHLEQHNIPDYGLPANRNHLAPGVDDEWFYGSKDDFEDSEQNSFIARIEHDFSDSLKLTNQTKYSKTTRFTVGSRASYNLGTDTVTRAAVTDDRENAIFSNQTNLTALFSTGGLKHSVTAGLEYTREHQDTFGLEGATTYLPAAAPGNSGIEPGHDVVRPGYSRGPGYTKGDTETIGLYAFDTIEITPKWSVTGGLRMDHYNTRYESYAIPRGEAAYVLNGPFHEGNEVYSGKLGITYNPVEEGTIYLAYSSTSTPPGTGNFSVNSTTSASGDITSSSNINSDPQVSDNIELGAKWDFFESRLTLTGAAFYTENTNFIYQDPLDATAYINDGGQKIKGFTLGAVGQITENWSVLASATYLDGEIDQSGSAIDGNLLARTPEWSGTLWTTYKLPKGFTAGLGFRCQSAVNTSTVDDAPTMAGFAQFDAMVQYDINEHANLRLNVYNLLDTRYVASTSGGGGGDAGGTGGSTGGGTDASGNRILMSPPISFALSMNYQF